LEGVKKFMSKRFGLVFIWICHYRIKFFFFLKHFSVQLKV
jgi:hypothetical protein